MCFLRHLNRRFVLQHRPDNQRTQQVKYCQNCEQRLKPMVSASAPTTSANSVLASHADIPVKPFAVATSLRPNTSEESVISAPDSAW